MLAVCLMTTLSGCVTSGSAPVPVARHLPAPPSYAKPVEVAEPKRGDDALLVAARERAGRKQANSRLTAFRNWYEDVRTSYEEAK
jgi:hypothetical protein